MISVGYAVVPLAVVLMMTALDIRIIRKRTGQESCDRVVRAALYSAKQADIRLRQRRLCAAADAAADQGIHALCRKEARQRAVAAAVGIYDPGRTDFSVPCFI